MLDLAGLGWSAFGLAVAGAVSFVVWSWYRAPKDTALGAVSDQWLAEQRLGRPDSHR
jgi:hypothetical protein